jgi:hypothetical protein
LPADPAGRHRGGPATRPKAELEGEPTQFEELALQTGERPEIFKYFNEYNQKIVPPSISIIFHPSTFVKYPKIFKLKNRKINGIIL